MSKPRTLQREPWTDGSFATTTFLPESLSIVQWVHPVDVTPKKESDKFSMNRGLTMVLDETNFNAALNMYLRLPDWSETDMPINLQTAETITLAEVLNRRLIQ
jgi:hypothetical protein